MKVLAHLFGPRIETRFISTLSLIVAIALVSLVIVVSVQIQELSERFREDQVRLLATLSRSAYPEPMRATGLLPPELLQVTTRGPEGLAHWLAPGTRGPVILSPEDFEEGDRTGYFRTRAGLVWVRRVLGGDGGREFETWLVFSKLALVDQQWGVMGKIVLVSAAILFSCFFLGSFLARSMLVPLERFTESMDRVAEGDLTPIMVPEAPENFGQFQEAFNVMLEQIRRNQEMERALLARDKMATVGQLASAVAHETRNPLAAISSLTQMLAEEVREDPRLREYTRVVLEEVARLDGNINHLLDYARPVQPRFQRVPVRRLVEDVQVLLGFEVRRQGVQLLTEIPGVDPEGGVGGDPEDPAKGQIAGEEDPGSGVAGDELVWVLDAGQIKQVLVNLVTNAVRACELGGRVRIGLDHLPGEELTLWVEDDGAGIPEEERERIFQPFYSASQGGTGLGLAVAARIVELHCGTIEVETGSEGRGCRFAIHIPWLEEGPELPAGGTPEGPSPWPRRA